MSPIRVSRKLRAIQLIGFNPYFKFGPPPSGVLSHEPVTKLISVLAIIDIPRSRDGTYRIDEANPDPPPG